MNKKKVFVTIGVSGIAFVIGYFINFFLTRYITDSIGTDAYGYVTLSKTIASYVVILTTSLNSYSARFITIAHHNGDRNKANIYFNSVFWSNFIFGLVLLFLVISLLPLIDIWLKVPPYIHDDVRVLIIFVFVNLFISLTGTAFHSSAYIADKLSIVAIFKGASYIVEAVSLLALYSLLPPMVFYTGVGLCMATIVNTIGYLAITKKAVLGFSLNIKLFSFQAVKELVISGIWNSFNSLGNTLNSGLDLMVSNSLLDSTSMGQASIVKSISTIFSNLFQMVAQPFQPTLLKEYAKLNTQEVLRVLKYSMKVSGLISNLAFGGIVSFGEYYYRLWVPNQNISLLYRLSIIAVASCIFEGAVYPLYYIYTLTIKNKVPCIITIIGGICNVLGMFVLIKNTNLGIYAVFITTAVIMSIINGITNPLYMARCLHQKWNTFYPQIIRHVIACIFVVSGMYVVSSIIKPFSWFQLIISAVIACIVGAILHLVIVFNKKERIDLIYLIKKKLSV